MAAEKQAKKQKGPKRPKPVLPRGFRDIEAGEGAAVAEMIARIGDVYEAYGFERLETPFFEYTESLGKFLPDQDRPNEGVFSLQDDDEAWLSLRYDLTAPLARFVAANLETLPKPYRSWRAGYVFRNEKPGPGRFRQFMQVDADTVGAPGPAADAEMCMMMADVLEAVGLERGQYVVRVNSRKVLDGLMDAAEVSPEQRLGVLRAIDKLDKLSHDDVARLLGEGRKDESGDYTEGAKLTEDQTAFLSGYLRRVTGDTEHALAAGFDTARLDASSRYRDGLAEIDAIRGDVEAAGYDRTRIQIDPSVVRGLEYYTGAVFEAELLFETVNDRGEAARFGSIGGGGRYDGLVGRFTAQDVPATGFSIGVSRLAAALKALGKLGHEEQPGPVVVTVMDKARMADYQAMAAELRQAGLKAEVYLGNPKQFGKQLSYADKRRSPVAIIQGTDEAEADQVQIKDLLAGAEAAQEITDNDAWRAARVAQQTVARADLVTTVKAILEAQGLLEADGRGPARTDAPTGSGDNP